MKNTLTLRAARAVVSAIGIAMIALGSAGAADLSPEDQCAIAKLRATWRHAKCLADAQIKGIRKGLTEEEVDAREASCREREDRRFEKAQERAEDKDSTCGTIDDAHVIDYGLTLTTDLLTSCDPSEPCDAETLSNATLHNRTPYNIIGSVAFMRIPVFCNKNVANFTGPGSIPRRMEPGQRGSASAGACLIQGVNATMQRGGAQIRCTAYSSIGTGYRTFQVVPVGDGCLVNRP